MTTDQLFAAALLIIGIAAVVAWFHDRRQPHPIEIITDRAIVSEDAAALDMLDAMNGKGQQ